MTIETMKLALEALEFDGFTPEDTTHRYYTTKAITALRTAIEQAYKQEPVAWMDASETALSWENYLDGMKPLYTTPPAAQPAPLQVSPTDFVDMVMDKEDAIGKPIFWAEWPNREKNT